MKSLERWTPKRALGTSTRSWFLALVSNTLRCKESAPVVPVLNRQAQSKKLGMCLISFVHEELVGAHKEIAVMLTWQSSGFCLQLLRFAPSLRWEALVAPLPGWPITSVGAAPDVRPPELSMRCLGTMQVPIPARGDRFLHVCSGVVPFFLCRQYPQGLSRSGVRMC